MKVIPELSETLRSNKDKRNEGEEGQEGDFLYMQNGIFIDIIYSHTCIFSYSTGRQKNNYLVLEII